MQTILASFFLDCRGAETRISRMDPVQSLGVVGDIRFSAFLPKKVTRLLLFGFCRNQAARVEDQPVRVTNAQFDLP